MRRSLLAVHRQPSEELRRMRSAPIPTGAVMAAAAADLPLDDEGVLERSRNVSVATIGTPVIRLTGRYNARWFVDAVALPHDSLRVLLQHMFSIAAALHRLVLDVTRADVEKACAFAAELDAYARVVLEAEEKILYALVDAPLRRLLRATAADNNNNNNNNNNNADNDDGDDDDDNDAAALQPARRAAAKARVRSLLAAVRGDALRAQQPVTVAAVQKWRHALDEVSRELLDYFAAKEAVLPRLVAGSIRGSREKRRLERHLLRFFSACGQEFRYAALLTAPLHLERVRADFETRHFRRDARPAYRAAVAQVDGQLFAIARSFEAASRKYEAKFSMAAFLSHYGHAAPSDRDVADGVVPVGPDVDRDEMRPSWKSGAADGDTSTISSP